VILLILRITVYVSVPLPQIYRGNEV